MGTSLDGRTLLVTGGGSGIGLATCVAASKAGYAVYAGIRPSERAEAARAKLAGLDETIAPLSLDVTDQAAVDAAIAAVLADHGRLDAVVNCAGIAIQGATEDFDDASVDQIIGANLIGPFRVIRAAAPVMREQRRGHIVNVTSIGARTVSPYFNFYAATKHGLAALSISLRYELEQFGIKVAMVEPGAINTGIAVKAQVLAPKESPHAEQIEELMVRIRAGLAEGIDPAIVGARITELLEDPDPPLRVVIGEDAERLAGLVREFEGDDLYLRVKSHWFPEEDPFNAGATPA